MSIGVALAAMATFGIASAMPSMAGTQKKGAERYCFTQWDDVSLIENAPYDGRFTFFRVRYEPMTGGRGFRGRQDKKWDHDTPRAERHFMKIMEELTTLRPKMDCEVVYAFGDPESFKYPIAYVSEPGFWTMNPQELAGIREYVKKGGFIMFDDFFAQAWYNFEERWREAFPDLQLVKLDASNPIFDSFYHIPSLEMFYEADGPYRGAKAEFWGAYEDNDPKKRLVMIADYNNDLGDYMEFSDEAWVPIALSNEAYKLMVNYVVYAMTH